MSAERSGKMPPMAEPSERAYESREDARAELTKGWDQATASLSDMGIAAEAREIAGAIIAVGAELLYLLDRKL